MHGRILAAAMCSAALVMLSLPVEAQYQQMSMAKFEGTCSGTTGYFVVREGGWPNHVIRFTLGSGQKIHFQLPLNSTYANGCGNWPGTNASYSPIVFE